MYILPSNVQNNSSIRGFSACKSFSELKKKNKTKNKKKNRTLHPILINFKCINMIKVNSSSGQHHDYKILAQ